jgi:hypothetical protein
LIGGGLSTIWQTLTITLASFIINYILSRVVGGRWWMVFPLEIEVSWLEREFEEEVKVVVAKNGDKVLGPNGLCMAFFQAC